MPRFWSLYTPLSDSLSSAAPFSRAVGAAAAEQEEEEEEEEEKEEEEEAEEEEEEVEAAGAAALPTESTTPAPTSSRSRNVRMPLTLHGVNGAPRHLIQLEVREQRLHIGTDARERP